MRYGSGTAATPSVAALAPSRSSLADRRKPPSPYAPRATCRSTGKSDARRLSSILVRPRRRLKYGIAAIRGQLIAACARTHKRARFGLLYQSDAAQANTVRCIPCCQHQKPHTRPCVAVADPGAAEAYEG